MEKTRKQKTDELSENVEQKTKQQKESNPYCKSLLEALQYVLVASRDSNLSSTLYRGERWSKYSFDYLQERMGLTDEQSIMLAIILEESICGHHADISDICRHLDLSKIETVEKLGIVSELIERGLVDTCGRNQYYIAEDAFEALKRNEVYVQQDEKCETVDDLFDKLFSLHLACHDREFNAKILNKKVLKLMEDNKHLESAKALLRFKDTLSDGEFRFLVVVALDTMMEREYGSTIWSRKWIFDDKKMEQSVNKNLIMGTSPLLKQQLVECAGNSGLASRNEYQLTTQAIRMINPDWKEQPSGSDVIRHSNIKTHKLYYNYTESKQVAELQSLLDENNFQKIQNRMKDRHMRGGFGCLFYGAPGTGKTESVYQLARMTGRDIFKVDFSQLRSKWVGESEKNVKEVFESYRKLAETYPDHKPILLLNEADSIISNRIETPERASEKSENTIQNIVLQEMEDFDGILIATTNLADSMDKAFERRFIYKIKFTNPSVQVLAKIWKAMLPELSVSDCDTLADLYPAFAGGQIENISRKVLVSETLYGENLALEAIVDLCQSEMLEKKQHGNHIGFRS